MLVKWLGNVNPNTGAAASIDLYAPDATTVTTFEVDEEVEVTEAFAYTLIQRGDFEAVDFVVNDYRSVGGPLVLAETGALVVVSPGLPSGRVGVAYSEVISASGGTAPYTYAVKAGSTLPDGLTLASNGTLSGTPTTQNAYNFIIVATDANSVEGEYEFGMDVLLGPDRAIFGDQLHNGRVGIAYNASVTAVGGKEPYVYTIDAETVDPLPDGLSMSAAGAITGTPTVLGNSTVTFVATDDDAVAVGGNISLYVDAA